MDESVKSRSLEFMNDSMKWPAWPQLPVVNRETDACGFILDGKIKVYISNIWDVETSIADMKFQNYDSWEEVVEAGWEVD